MSLTKNHTNLLTTYTRLKILLILSLGLVSCDLQGEPNFKAEGGHYLDFPLTKKDFTQWHTMGSALFL